MRITPRVKNPASLAHFEEKSLNRALNENGEIGGLDSSLSLLGKLVINRSSQSLPMQPIRLRVSPTMADAIKAQSMKTELSESAWMRAVIGQHLNLTDPDDLQPVRRYGGGGPDAAALTALRMQLHQLGGLLTQVAKVARLDGNSARHADAEGTLADVREAIRVIAAWQEARREKV